MTNDAASDAPLLQVAAITRTFGGFTALDNISVDIRKGERFGLIGPNGAGKTTLINCISGALRPQVGNVIFCGENINELPPHLRARRGIARSFQIPRPFKSMTVLENLMVGLDFARVDSSQPEEEVAIASDADEARLQREYLRKIPLRRAGTVRDQAMAVLFLASDDAGWITGQTLIVDGGELGGGDWYDAADAPPLPDEV